MAKAGEVARVFDYLAKCAEGSHIEVTRLNKMLYYAQGHALSELGHALFENQIDAWDYGPVVAVVYKRFQKIMDACDARGIDDIQIDPEDMELILDVWEQYGKYKSGELVAMTHQAGTPWSDTYVPGEKNVHIPQDRIEGYFSRPENRLQRGMAQVGELPTVSALPAEEYDPDEDAVWEAHLNDAQ